MTSGHDVNGNSPADGHKESFYLGGMPKSADQEIGRRLAEARNAAEITQAELAKAISVDQSTVGHWERGRGRPGINDVPKIEKRLGIKADWLIYGRGGPDGRPPRGQESSPTLKVAMSKPIDLPGGAKGIALRSLTGETILIELDLQVIEELRKDLDFLEPYLTKDDSLAS